MGEPLAQKVLSALQILSLVRPMRPSSPFGQEILKSGLLLILPPPLGPVATTDSCKVRFGLQSALTTLVTSESYNNPRKLGLAPKGELKPRPLNSSHGSTLIPLFLPPMPHPTLST